MTCCTTFEDAQIAGTDNEGYGALIRKFSTGYRIGSNLPEISFCPWCGKKLIEEQEPQ